VWELDLDEESGSMNLAKGATMATTKDVELDGEEVVEA